MRIRYWSSDVCSSDLCPGRQREQLQREFQPLAFLGIDGQPDPGISGRHAERDQHGAELAQHALALGRLIARMQRREFHRKARAAQQVAGLGVTPQRRDRSEEHTSELQSLMRISYAVFCLKKKKT